MRQTFMMKQYTDKQNYILNKLAYANIESKSWEPGQKLIDLVKEPYKSELQEAGLGELVIVDYANNNESGSHSGFCAIAFKDPSTGEVGMSFRGTENLDKFTSENQVDMMDNVHTALNGDSKQKREALEFFEKNKSLYGDNYLYGHSKGGELASEVYVDNYDEVRQMHVINPQPINPEELTKKQLEALKSDKVDVVIIDGDTVHSLGGWPYSDENTRYVENNGSQNGFFGPHLLASATIDGDNYVIEDKPFEKYPDQHLFVKAVRPIISAAQKGKLKKLSGLIYIVSCLYTFVVRDIPAMIEKLEEIVIAFYEKLIEAKEKFDEFVANFKEFVSQVVTSVKRWFNNNFNPGYKSAVENPQIEVNPYKLRSYASRINEVNRRISRLDGRLDSLYLKVGLLGLWNLMRADMLMGYSWRLSRASSYLTSTASAFENAENDLCNKLN